MKKVLLTLSFLILPSLSALATERTLSLTLTSNYVFRGITQTSDKAAVQANYEISQSKGAGLYAGFFTSNVSRGAEVDLFAGFRLSSGKQNKFIVDLGVIEYMYTDNTFASMSHELYAGLQYELSYLKLFFGENEARYYDLGVGFYTLGDLEMILHLGEESAGGTTGNDMSVSLQKEFGSSRIGATLTYEDKSANDNTELFFFISSDF